MASVRSVLESIQPSMSPRRTRYQRPCCSRISTFIPGSRTFKVREVALSLERSEACSALTVAWVTPESELLEHAATRTQVTSGTKAKDMIFIAPAYYSG